MDFYRRTGCIPKTNMLACDCS